MNNGIWENGYGGYFRGSLVLIIFLTIAENERNDEYRGLIFENWRRPTYLDYMRESIEKGEPLSKEIRRADEMMGRGYGGSFEYCG